MTENIENRMVVDSEWNKPEPRLHCDDCGGRIMEMKGYYDIWW